MLVPVGLAVTDLVLLCSEPLGFAGVLLAFRLLTVVVHFEV